MNNLVLDIYHGNGGIDLAEWKARHALWAIIAKCGGSEDSRLDRFEETTFVEQCQQARILGLHVGAYYYSDALDTNEALLDAMHCVDKCMRGQRLDMPLYLDIEEPAQLRLPMHQLTDIVTTPGFSDELISLYLARDLSAGESHPDDDEFLNIVRMPLQELVDLIRRGEVPDAKTVCAVMLADKIVNG